MRSTLVLGGMVTTAMAMTGCRAPNPPMTDACVVERPPYLSARVIPSRDELRRMLEVGGTRYASTLENPIARQRFRALLERLSTAFASGTANDTCRAFRAMREEFQHAGAGAPPERNAFALALDLAAA